MSMPPELVASGDLNASDSGLPQPAERWDEAQPSNGCNPRPPTSATLVGESAGHARDLSF